MKHLAFFLLLAWPAFGQIVYPVDIENDRFTYKIDVNGDGDWDDPGELARGKRWISTDPSGPPVNANPGLIILEESRVTPPYDPATEKIVNIHWVDDHVAQTAIRTWDVEPLTQAELDARAEQTGRQAKRVSLANAIATLRSWADDLDTWSSQAETAAANVTSGNAVATLQSTLERLAVIYEREAIFKDRFADLLEVQGISAE